MIKDFREIASASIPFATVGLRVSGSTYCISHSSWVHVECILECMHCPQSLQECISLLPCLELLSHIASFLGDN